MASQTFDPKTGKARVFFRIGGRQFNKTIKLESARAARALCATIEQTVADLERGRLALPPAAELVPFVLSGGKLIQNPVKKVAQATTPLRLGELFDRYRADPPPHLEPSTRRMQEVHFKRLREVFPSKELLSFDKAVAQEYVAQRSRDKYRGKTTHRETIEKELKTLRQAWAWVADRDASIPPPSFTLKELSLPKAREKRPFMSWCQIEREIARGGLKQAEISELWDCLWLDTQEVKELLEHVRETKSPEFLFPMVCFAAYTGARRSELCRSRVGDWSFDHRVVKIRQKKRDKDKTLTYRDVPIHPVLADVTEPWFASHPGGQMAFCQADLQELTGDTVSYFLEKSLQGSKWSALRGWHVLRHSFASNLAAARTDQRIIDRWMGHSTEVRWRYQHLRPEDQQDAIGVL